MGRAPGMKVRQAQGTAAEARAGALRWLGPVQPDSTKRAGVQPDAPTGRNLLADQLRVAALEAEATRFQRFARDAPIGILLLDADGAVQFANDEYLRISGRSREEFDAERFRLEPAELPEWLDPAQASRYEAECARPDGSMLPILVGISHQVDGLAAFVVDLSAEKAAERAREQSEERYRALAEKLEETNRRKDEFLGILSHELRNPLAPIRNALHVLAHREEDAGRAAQARTIVERQVAHLSRLVDDLLDVTRISSGRVQLHRRVLDLAALARETVDDHRIACDSAGVQVTVHLPEQPVLIEGDATRLAQVLGNLLANSTKFTPRGGTIAVEVERDAAGVAVMRVRDTGEGIDAELLPRVFDAFAQAERTLARTRGGLGLGLTVVKGLVELHGGTVTASSAGHGAGTEVVVRLPPAPVARHAVPGAPGPAMSLARASVLVIEDNVDAAETLRQALEIEGMTVTTAHDGVEGLRLAREVRPEVVLCDIGLPGELDGYAVARAMRADPQLHRVPLIAVTGYAGPDDRRRARAAGFERHLAKPVGIDELLDAIASVAGSSDAPLRE